MLLLVTPAETPDKFEDCHEEDAAHQNPKMPMGRMRSVRMMVTMVLESWKAMEAFIKAQHLCRHDSTAWQWHLIW